MQIFTKTLYNFPPFVILVCGFVVTSRLLVFQLFDTEHHLNRNNERYLFTTEGHIFPIRREWRRKSWLSDDVSGSSKSDDVKLQGDKVVVVGSKANLTSNVSGLDYVFMSYSLLFRNDVGGHSTHNPYYIRNFRFNYVKALATT